jgi:hypothetical protein
MAALPARPFDSRRSASPARSAGDRRPPSRSPAPLRRELVRWIADQLADDTAGDTLRRVLENDTRILGLEVAERETILRVLEDPPPGLTELRATLFQEHMARTRGEVARASSSGAAAVTRRLLGKEIEWRRV